MQNKLHVKAYDLNATTYDYFLKQERRAQAEFEHELKQREIEQQNKNLSDLIYKADDMQ